MDKRTTLISGTVILILLFTLGANLSLVTVYAGSAGTISASTAQTPGALGSIVMITVTDPDLAAGNSNPPQVFASRTGGGTNVIVPTYQAIDRVWVGFIRTTSLTFFDSNGNGILDDVNPSIIVDLDNSGRFSAGDTLITGPSLSTGTTLSVIPTPATNTGSESNAGKFRDVNGNGRSDSGESIYHDQDGSGTVSSSDKRLVVVGTYLAGSLVAAYDTDVGLTLTRFNMESRPTSSPQQDTTPPANGFRNSPPYTGEPDLSVVDVGAIVAAVPGVAAGDSITVTYNEANPPTPTSVTVSRKNTPGVVSFDRASYTMFSKPTVTVTDPDLNLDPTKLESLTWQGTNLLTVKSSSKPAGVAISASETGVNTATFTAQFTLGPAGTQGAIQGLEVKPGDVLTADYADPNIATNESSPRVTLTAGIVTNTGTLAFNKANYNLIDTASLTLSDPDLNVQSDAADQWKSTEWNGILSAGGAIRVTSTTDPTGIVLPTIETGQNTGIFTAKLNFTSNKSSGNALRVSSGDTVTAVYKDWTPAGIQNIQLGTSFADVRATAQISPVPGSKTYLVRITEAESLDTLNVPKTSFSRGETMVASGATSNGASTSMSLLITIQITDPEGTVFPTHFVTVTLAPSQPFTFRPGFTIPNNAKTGTWQLEVNVFDKFPAEGGVPLALGIARTFTVN